MNTVLNGDTGAMSGVLMCTTYRGLFSYKDLLMEFQTGSVNEAFLALAALVGLPFGVNTMPRDG